MPDEPLGLGSLPDNAFGLRPQALSGREPNPQDLSFTYIHLDKSKHARQVVTQYSNKP